MQLEKIKYAVPNKFNFYHLGSVEIANNTIDDRISILDSHASEELYCIGIQIFDEDEKYLFILTFDRGLDISTYTEMAHIIASQFASNLSEDAIVSAPLNITPERVKKVESLHEPILISHYFHHHQDNFIPLEMRIWLQKFENHKDV